MTNISPTEVGLLFDSQTKAFTGAAFSLYVDGGQEGAGGAKVVFAPISVPTTGVPKELSALGLFAGAANTSTIHVFHDTTGDPPQLTNEATLNFGQANLVGVSGASGVLCDTCDFLKWGAWLASLNFNDGQSAETHQVQVTALGWWVAGDLPTIGQLPAQGIASYDGHTIGNAVTYVGATEAAAAHWATYPATGLVHMNWDFALRSGTLQISNFVDPGGNLPVLNMTGTMTMPGQLSAINRFSGPLVGTLVSGELRPSISGGAIGSFAANGADKSAGVIGNWGAGNSNYSAAGIFGAGRTPPPVTSLSHP